VDKPGGDATQAVFNANAPADPKASALCQALYDAPSEAQAACCKRPPAKSPLTTTCAGTLSSALQLKAVTLDDTKAAACIAARTAQLGGCGWVGALTPLPPDACAGVLVGTADDGARCRSSLECAAGLRCHGAGPLDTGRCGKPLADGNRCGGSVDGLALVVNEAFIDRDHPECAGICALGRCGPAKKTNDACMSDLECGAANHCEAHVCAAGRIALGTPCKVGGCVDGARCLEGTCQALRAEGGKCANDFDCARGGCVDGVCGMRCNALAIPGTH
jgi:hypothetical protein